MRRRASAPSIAGALMVTSLLLSACALDRQAAPDPTAPLVRPPTPTFTEGNCLMPVPKGSVVTCGTVSVPEDRTKPDGRKVQLAVARIHSHATSPDPDPVVYLHGGPGTATLANGIETKVTLDILDHRDLIVFDQRGAGLSDPNLECPEREAAFLQVLSAATPWSAEISSFTTALATCYQRLTRDRHVDLDQYNTVTNAEDLNDIRVALGLSQWNLWGESYGTRLAMEEMRSFPEGVRSVVLDSVYPPTAGAVDDAVRSGERAFKALANGCAQDTACHRAIPDLNKLIDQLATRLDATPLTVTSKPPDGGATHKLVITGDDAIGGLFTAMYDSDLIPLLPKIINDLAQGDNSIVPEIANRGIAFVDETAEGAFLSTECADNNVKIDPRVVAGLRQDPGRAGLALLASWSLFCGSWPVDALPARFSETVHSDIPAMVFAGEYDPITPPENSRRAATDLGNAKFIEVPRGGHAVAQTTLCTLGIFTRFFDDLAKVDVGCAASMTPREFIF